MKNKYLASLEKFGINLGLERIKLLLEKLDNPQLKFKSLHVAGTNGKGSTCAMIASILKEAGYKVGLYTSPHLFKYNERIKINGRDISDKDFNTGIKLIKKIASQPPNHLTAEPPTVFEALTALAFWYFAKKKVNYAVVEVGMGGRLDATNVITPLVSVITNIDLEHTAILGNTLAKIAVEKAAIIKPRVPVITAEVKDEALKVLKYQAQKNGSVLIQIGSEGAGLPSGLLGEHQKINAACAVAAVRLAGIEVGKQTVLAGLQKVKWPARFQIVKNRPLTIVDGAHNPAGITVLAAALRRQFPGRKFAFIVGTQQDKDAAAMLAGLSASGGLATRIIHVHSSHQNAVSAGTVPLRDALKATAAEDRVVTGSLYLAADYLRIAR